LFQLWDQHNFGKIKLRELAQNIVTLGFCPNEETVYPFFSKQVKEYYGFKSEISEEEMMDADI
jgi:hypothetical protein